MCTRREKREIENYSRELALLTVGTGKLEIYGSRLEILVTINVTVLNLKSPVPGRRLETQAGLLCYNFEKEFLLLETSVSALKVFN